MEIDNDRTVFVVDNDAATRAAFVALVKSKGGKAQAFASAEAFLESCDASLRGCVVVDVRLAGMSGLELLSTLRERKWHLPVIVLTGDADVPLAVRAMQGGAFTFLEKPAADLDLSRAIEQALEAESSSHEHRRERIETEARLATLTDDELEVFRRLLAGHANKRIASDLDIGLRTVELRRSNIMKKMQATSLPDLVRMAILIEFLKATGPIL